MGIAFAGGDRVTQRRNEVVAWFDGLDRRRTLSGRVGHVEPERHALSIVEAEVAATAGERQHLGAASLEEFRPLERRDRAIFWRDRVACVDRHCQGAACEDPQRVGAVLTRVVRGIDEAVSVVVDVPLRHAPAVPRNRLVGGQSCQPEAHDGCVAVGRHGDGDQITERRSPVGARGHRCLAAAVADGEGQRPAVRRDRRRPRVPIEADDISERSVGVRAVDLDDLLSGIRGVLQARPGHDVHPTAGRRSRQRVGDLPTGTGIDRRGGRRQRVEVGDQCPRAGVVVRAGGVHEVGEHCSTVGGRQLPRHRSIDPPLDGPGRTSVGRHAQFHAPAALPRHPGPVAVLRDVHVEGLLIEAAGPAPRRTTVL